MPGKPPFFTRRRRRSTGAKLLHLGRRSALLARLHPVLRATVSGFRWKQNGRTINWSGVRVPALDWRCWRGWRGWQLPSKWCHLLLVLPKIRKPPKIFRRCLWLHPEVNEFKVNSFKENLVLTFNAPKWALGHSCALFKIWNVSNFPVNRLQYVCRMSIRCNVVSIESWRRDQILFFV